MKMHLLAFVTSVLLASSPSQAGETNESRDVFIREIVATLIETKASHISAEQHVETAFRAWQRYQDLIKVGEGVEQLATPKAGENQP
jgi:hypothetical protein